MWPMRRKDGASVRLVTAPSRIVVSVSVHAVPGAGGTQLRLAGEPLLPGVPDDLGEQLVLVGEEPVDRADRDAGARADARDGRAAVAALRGDLGGGVEQLRAGVVVRHDGRLAASASGRAPSRRCAGCGTRLVDVGQRVADHVLEQREVDVGVGAVGDEHAVDEGEVERGEVAHERGLALGDVEVEAAPPLLDDPARLAAHARRTGPAPRSRPERRSIARVRPRRQ